jgi:hypothetical protein
VCKGHKHVNIDCKLLILLAHVILQEWDCVQPGSVAVPGKACCYVGHCLLITRGVCTATVCTAFVVSEYPGHLILLIAGRRTQVVQAAVADLHIRSAGSNNQLHSDCSDTRQTTGTDLSAMVPAVSLVASSVCSCVAALVAARLPATTLVPSIELVGVINVLQVKADQQSMERTAASARVSIS